MTRFHLHLKNRVGFVPDLEGIELPSEVAAREEAIRNIRSIVSAEVQNGVVDLDGSIEIATADGKVLAVVPFAEAVRISDAS
jgi:hypothetical protein